MSKIQRIICDIRDCGETANPVTVTFLNIEIVPTGNSDYSAYEESTLKNDTIDLCETHRQLYEIRMSLVKDRKGLTFKTPMNTTNSSEETSE